MPSLCAALPQPISPLRALADSERPDAPASLAVDGKTNEESRWLSSGEKPESWLEIGLPVLCRVGGLHVSSGYRGKDPLVDFSVQFLRDGEWVAIPSATVVGNKSTALALIFDDTVDVTTNRIRITITRTSQNVARVAEVVVWPYSEDGVPEILKTSGGPLPPAPLIPVFLNQSGFNRGAPKRFTTPNVEDGTAFAIRPAGGGEAVFKGTVLGRIGDFTKFEPVDEQSYVVVVADMTSVPFRVGPWWLERVTYQGAIDFMIDSRHYLGTYRGVCVGSFGWRDDHHFGWELNTLVPQWLSNPSAYENMPRQIVYERPTNPALWGALEPPAQDAPDIVKLIHWGADVIVTQGRTHELLKAQLAYFLYAWPTLATWLPEQNRRVVSEFVFRHWRDVAADDKYRYDLSPEHDLLALKIQIGSTKGSYPPGFSIEPNLLMYAVELREQRADAERYLEAAVRQADWIVQNLDWEDPLTTKGQRVGEFVTMTGLAHLLAAYPDRAPAGLREKIQSWAKVIIRRSDNLWDFRKLGDDPDQWVPTGSKPTMWNEVGNVVGLPAEILAARPFVDDPGMRARLDQIMWAHFDAMFGRNPVGRHFSYAAAKELEGVELGWFSRYQGGIGQLKDARFVLDGSPKNEHYPYHPERGNVGWSEGWIQHNTPFNLSLAYLARADTRVAAEFEKEALSVTLHAPLNFDYHRAESGTVIVTSSSGDREAVTVTELDSSAEALIGRLPLSSNATAHPGDGKLQVADGGTVTVSYGFGYFGHEVVVIRQPTVKPE